MLSRVPKHLARRSWMSVKSSYRLPSSLVLCRWGVGLLLHHIQLKPARSPSRLFISSWLTNPLREPAHSAGSLLVMMLRGRFQVSSEGGVFRRTTLLLPDIRPVPPSHVHLQLHFLTDAPATRHSLALGPGGSISGGIHHSSRPRRSHSFHIRTFHDKVDLVSEAFLELGVRHQPPKAMLAGVLLLLSLSRRFGVDLALLGQGGGGWRTQGSGRSFLV